MHFTEATVAINRFNGLRTLKPVSDFVSESILIDTFEWSQWSYFFWFGRETVDFDSMVFFDISCWYWYNSWYDMISMGLLCRREYDICRAVSSSLVLMHQHLRICITHQGTGLRTDLPSTFLQLVTELESLHSKLTGKPPAWCRSIVNSGEKLKLLNVDTSTRGLLGKSVEKQLRVVKLICEFERAEEARPNFMQNAEWTKDEDITTGVLALTDLHSVMSDNDVSLGLPKETELRDFLANAAMKASESVCSELVSVRQSMTILSMTLSARCLASSTRSLTIFLSPMHWATRWSTSTIIPKLWKLRWKASSKHKTFVTPMPMIDNQWVSNNSPGFLTLTADHLAVQSPDWFCPGWFFWVIVIGVLISISENLPNDEVYIEIKIMNHHIK